MTCLRHAVCLAASIAVTAPGLASAGGRREIPRFFEPNMGQADARARFLMRSGSGTVFFAGAEVAVTAPDASPLRVVFVGPDPAARVEAAQPRPGTVNYFIGSDPARWRSGLPRYGEVRYSGLYPGVDLSYSADGRPLKGTYTVAAGADPGRIRWRYDGGEARLDGAGRLHVGAGDAELVEEAPVAWQEVEGGRVPVAARYVLDGDGTVGFALGAYDGHRPLVIDPVIVYSTYLGGSIFEIAWEVAADAAGNAYIAGYTASSNFPTVSPYQGSPGGQGDAFVAKFAPDGTPVYSTYLGGSYVDQANDVAVDAQGNAYVTGDTGSVNFPIVNPLQAAYAGGWDGFVTKLNATGSALLYSTYLGGASAETGWSIAVDAAGSAYVAGETQSANFPTKQPFQPTLHGTIDAFVSKLAPAGNALVYSTFLGGNAGEMGQAIAVTRTGEAVVTGDTTSISSFPTKNAFQPVCAPSAAVCWDAFVTRFSADGQFLVFSTYLGGNDVEIVDRGFSVAVDPVGVAYVTGMTGSTNFPILNAYQPVYGGQVDVFLARFNPTGGLLSSTYLGGSNSDVGYGVAVTRRGPAAGIHLSGLTISEDFPVANPLQSSLGGFEDPFVARLNLNASALLFSSYLGGTDGREEYGATGIALDRNGNAYVTGGTEATDFPIQSPYQATVHGSYDVFLTRIDPQQ
jgi:beta-propeller repeat-containing protein